MNWNILVEEVRSQLPQDAEGVFVLMGNDRAMKVASQWPSFTAFPEDVKGSPPPKPHEKWSWLWNQVEKYPEDIRVATGLDRRTFTRVVDQLIQARIIFPNGTVHPEAINLIRAKMIAGLRRQGQNA